MKVNIDCDKRVKFRGSDEYVGGWFYRERLPDDQFDQYTDDYPRKSERCATYAEARALALRDGHEISNGGWLRRMLSWNFNNHAMDGYPGWEIANPGEQDKYARHPAFVKLEHKRKSGDDVESYKLCQKWDDLAEVDFYQRDWTDSGIPFCADGEVYWSGWWFATFRDRDRFLEFARKQKGVRVVEQ